MAEAQSILLQVCLFCWSWRLFTLNLRRRRREAALKFPESWWHLTMWRSRASYFMIIPNSKRHPINTKTDQLPISEVTTGLPRPYHNIYPHFTIFFHFFRQKQLFCFLSKLKVADRRVQNEAETLLSTWQKPDRGKQNTNSYISVSYTHLTLPTNREV